MIKVQQSTQLSLELITPRLYPHLHMNIFHERNKMFLSLLHFLRGPLLRSDTPIDTPQALQLHIEAWLRSEGVRYIGCRPRAVVLLQRAVNGVPALRICQEGIYETDLAHIATYTFLPAAQIKLFATRYLP